MPAASWAALDLVVNKTTDTATIKWTRIVVGTTDPEDAATKARVNVWAQDPAYQAQINQVIGFSNVDLVRNYNGDNMMGDAGQRRDLQRPEHRWHPG